MKVKELKEWLKYFNNDTDIIISYSCNDEWYNYYGSDVTIDKDEREKVVLNVEN